MTILGPKLVSSEGRDGFLGNTIDSIFWQVSGDFLQCNFIQLSVACRSDLLGSTGCFPKVNAHINVIWVLLTACCASPSSVASSQCFYGEFRSKMQDSGPGLMSLFCASARFTCAAGLV